jgi:hypothetical protein
VRAGLASSIQESTFTSGQQRLCSVAQRGHRESGASKPALLQFIQSIRGDDDTGLPFNLQDYLDLLDTSGRAVHPGKHGAIPANTPRLLSLFGLDTGEWLKTVSALHIGFQLFVGAPHRLRTLAEGKGWRWVRGHAAARRLYARANE